MEVQAHAKFIRISPKKVRLVANLVAGMKPSQALLQLKIMQKNSAGVIEKLLKSAMANAQNNFNIDPETLVISKLIVNQGPTMRRYRPRAMGRAGIIRKKTSHISLALSEGKDVQGKESKVEPNKIKEHKESKS